jgi:hypothetical protein
LQQQRQRILSLDYFLSMPLFLFSFSTYQQQQQQQRRKIRFASVFHARTSYPSQLVFLLFIGAIFHTHHGRMIICIYWILAKGQKEAAACD